MELFLIVLLLLFTIGLSNMINHFIPFIPVPLIQIALGGILAILPMGLHVPMEPELFFVLFIAPLLFNDGKNVPRSALWKLRVPILLLALGLVLVTVLIIGYLIHWLIPSIPLPAAFALAAILSPTDVVAVGAMASRVKLPKVIMHTLEGEGLMNDASGLVAFKFAVAATVTGYFSLVEASLSFIIIALGGLIGGGLIAFMIIRLRVIIRRLGMEDVTIHMLIQILTPFVIYLSVEHFHFSGILGVVAGGIVHAIDRDHEQSPTIKLQIVSNSTWSVILFILNGLVFVLLGFQVPGVANSIFQNAAFNNKEVIGYIIIISISLFALRFAWVLMAWWTGWKVKKEMVKPSFKAIGMITVSGVRGAVTLAGAFTIPFALEDGSPFPERSLIIFIAAGVILATLLVTSIFLPIIARSKEEYTGENKAETEKRALIHSHLAAIKAVESSITNENRDVAVRIISKYNLRLNQAYAAGSQKNQSEMRERENKIRLIGIEAEEKEIENLVNSELVDGETVYLYLEHIQRMKMAVTNRMKYRRLIFSLFIKKLLLMISCLFSIRKRELIEQRNEHLHKFITLKVKTAKAAIREIKEKTSPEDRGISLIVIAEYSSLISRFRRETKVSERYKQINFERDLQYIAIQAERDDIQDMFEEGTISFEIAQKIRQYINIREASTVEESNYGP
ncbi:Na+/H+ antiporter [Bacillus cihuensis]|uniref:Na+/H+ antiporter n=1 Tax=Bacillus cihuensis TaxID=1208599 RepID=UPI00042400F0|nr:Na+/H+ antiporter [Bacillus cihuensis]